MLNLKHNEQSTSKNSLNLILFINFYIVINYFTQMNEQKYYTQNPSEKVKSIAIGLFIM